MALVQTTDEQLKHTARMLVDHARVAAAVKRAPVAGPADPNPSEPTAPVPSMRGPSL
jgi:hypothetical protein